MIGGSEMWEEGSECSTESLSWTYAGGHARRMCTSHCTCTCVGVRVCAVSAHVVART